MANLRRLRAASVASPIPNLATLLAGGAIVLGCQDPVCGDTRATELRIHGLNASHELKDRNLAAAMHEVGVALGVLPHTVPSSGITVPSVDPAGVTSGVLPNPPPVQAPKPGLVVGQMGVVTVFPANRRSV